MTRFGVVLAVLVLGGCGGDSGRAAQFGDGAGGATPDAGSSSAGRSGDGSGGAAGQGAAGSSSSGGRLGAGGHATGGGASGGGSAGVVGTAAGGTSGTAGTTNAGGAGASGAPGAGDAGADGGSDRPVPPGCLHCKPAMQYCYQATADSAGECMDCYPGHLDCDGPWGDGPWDTTTTGWGCFQSVNSDPQGQDGLCPKGSSDDPGGWCCLMSNPPIVEVRPGYMLNCGDRWWCNL